MNALAVEISVVLFSWLGALSYEQHTIDAGMPETQAGDEYVYVEEPGKTVAIRRNGRYYYGYLNSTGNFTPDVSYPPTKVGASIRSGPPFRCIDLASAKPVEFVYEFRSGLLIRGMLTKEGEFIPDEGSRVMNFKDYKYPEDPHRIYNLPGKFVKKSTAKKPSD
jgi:hypothetical protein